jgi:hypothetical protein
MTPADSERPFRRIAVIIRRDLAPAAAHVRDELWGFVALAAVIIDRRYGERRRTDVAPSGERRQADRRCRRTAKRVRDDGWAVVTVEDSTARGS